MHVCLLGPLLVRDGAAVVAVGGTRQRAVLAYLALRAGEVVAPERMVVDLWGEDAPLRSANTLQQTIHRLRRRLPAGVLRTSASGYAVRLAPDGLDVAEFTDRVARGRALVASGDAAGAVRELVAAEGLWRGEALADFRYEPFAQNEIARLEELRLGCLESRAEALLATRAAPSTVLAVLEPLAVGHPGRERLCELLMLAYYRDGRQAEAVDAYRRLARHLREELGLEPSPALADLEHRVLVHDPRLAGAAGRPTPPAGLALLSGDVPGRASRRLVTVVCAQVSAPASDGAAIDPETWHALVSRRAADVARVVVRHGGEVGAVVGAQVVAVFGVGSVHEDDAVRGVVAAVGAAVPARGAAPAVRCGVASGEAIVVGTDAGSVSGDVVPRAVELARSAGPGGVVVDRRTSELTGAAVEVEAAGGVLQVVRARPGARPVRLLTGTPFVGREVELDALRAVYADVRGSGRPRAVLVTGEAGIGKTRLLRELAAAAPDALVLRGRCPPYGESSTYAALREMVAAAGAPLTTGALTDLLAPAPDARRVADVLADVLPEQGDRRTDPALLVWAVRRFVEILAARRPVVVVLDDLHWAQDTLLDVAEQVADGLARGDAAVLSIAAARPDLVERRPAWPRLLRVHLELGTLAQQAVSRLLQVLSQGLGIGGAVRDHLLEAAGGNPLFLEQLVAWNAERPDRGRDTEVPPSITALVTARLQRLGPAEQEVLDVAAVLGRDVDAADVVALVPEQVRAGAARHLAAIAVRGLLVLREPSPAGPFVDASTARYAFRHALIREVAYRSVPRLTRARLHERVARRLDRSGGGPDVAAAGPDLVGFHLERSVLDRRELGADLELLDDVARDAALHLERAAARSGDVGDVVRSAQLYRRAAEVLPARDRDAARPLVGLGAALTELGRFDDAAEVLARAAAVSRDAGSDLWAAHARVTQFALGFRNDVGAVLAGISHEAGRLLDVFERHDDGRGAAKVWRLTAETHWTSSRAAEAERAWEQSARFARAAGADGDVTEVLGWLASAALWGPSPVDEGVARCRGYVAELAGRPLQRAVVQLHLAGLLAMRGEFAAARALVAAGLEVYDSTGASLTSAVREPAAYAAALEGDVDAAETYLRHEDRVLEAMSEKGYRAGICAQLAHLVARDGARLAEAQAFLATARQLIEPGDTASSVMVSMAASRIALLQDEGRAAVRSARDAVAEVELTDFATLHAEALEQLAAALRVHGPLDEAVAVSERAVAAHLHKGNLPGARRARSVHPIAPR